MALQDILQLSTPRALTSILLSIVACNLVDSWRRPPKSRISLATPKVLMAIRWWWIFVSRLSALVLTSAMERLWRLTSQRLLTYVQLMMVQRLKPIQSSLLLVHQPNISDLMMSASTTEWAYQPVLPATDSSIVRRQ